MGFGSEFPMVLNWLQGRDTESHQLRLWSVIQLRNWMYEMSCFVVLTRLQMCLQDKIKGNCCLVSLKCPSFWPSQVPCGLSVAVAAKWGNSSGMKNELKYRNRNKSKGILPVSANSTQSFLIWPTLSCCQDAWIEDLGKLISPGSSYNLYPPWYVS